MAAAGIVAWHLDGFWRDADEYEIPGFAESRALRGLGDEDDDDDDEDHDDAVRGRLPGSQLEARGGALGLSYIGERGFFGAAVSRYEAEYGLPGGHEHGHHDDDHDDEGHAHREISNQETRIDIEGGLENPFRGFDALNLTVGINRYEHVEIEPDGDIATEFDNDAYEVRLELVHQPMAGWRGALGTQYSDREFSAIGEEAFIAPVDTRTLGAFWVGERDLGNFELEAGVRLEGVRTKPSDNRNRSFTSYAFSLGAVIPVEDHWSVGLLADYSARAPIAEELFSDGPHLATGAFEIGNPDLDEEKALSLSINVRYADDDWLFNSTLYYTRFADFIFETPTGDEEDDLPVFVFLQEDADFFGFDAELRRTVARWDGGSSGPVRHVRYRLRETRRLGQRQHPACRPPGTGWGCTPSGVRCAPRWTTSAYAARTASPTSSCPPTATTICAPIWPPMCRRAAPISRCSCRAAT
jgi:iron complex outermembrane recepter protein